MVPQGIRWRLGDGDVRPICRRPFAIYRGRHIRNVSSARASDPFAPQSALWTQTDLRNQAGQCARLHSHQDDDPLGGICAPQSRRDPAGDIATIRCRRSSPAQCRLGIARLPVPAIVKSTEENERINHEKAICGWAHSDRWRSSIDSRRGCAIVNP
jgi:hypothetical protein